MEYSNDSCYKKEYASSPPKTSKKQKTKLLPTVTKVRKQKKPRNLCVTIQSDVIKSCLTIYHNNIVPNYASFAGSCLTHDEDLKEIFLHDG